MQARTALQIMGKFIWNSLPLPSGGFKREKVLEPPLPVEMQQNYSDDIY